jgi:ElaB/YqjD/DUF883 family membrane-anchored ribosome-binding protein
MTNDTSNGPSIDREANDGAGELQKGTRHAAETVQHDLKSAADEVRKGAGHVAEMAKEEAVAAGKQVEGMANEQKNAMAAHLDGIAGAIRHAASDLESESSPGARVTREAADRVGQLATALKENSVGDLVGMAESFGRRQPAAFLGASMLAGFAASRFLVASGHRTHPHKDNQAEARRPVQTGRPSGESQQEGDTL